MFSHTPKTRRAKNLTYYLTGIIACVAIPWGSGCSSAPAAVQAAPPKVTVAHLENRELTDFDEYNGWTDASATVEVRSRVRGHVDKVHFKDGGIFDQIYQPNK